MNFRANTKEALTVVNKDFLANRITMKIRGREIALLGKEFPEAEVFDDRVELISQEIELDGTSFGTFRLIYDYKLTSFLIHPESENIYAFHDKDSHFHPHINAYGQPCFGSHSRIVMEAEKFFHLADLFLFGTNLLKSYVPSQAYEYLEAWTKESVRCQDCGYQAPKEEACKCAYCEALFCEDCVGECRNCGDFFCYNCTETCQDCGYSYCDECIATCSSTGEIFCLKCIKSCSQCDKKLGPDQGKKIKNDYLCKECWIENKEQSE